MIKVWKWNLNISLLLLFLGCNLSVSSAATFFAPWTAGESWQCTQSNGGSTSHTGSLNFAWDFTKSGALGQPVLAAASGTIVVKVDTVTGYKEGSWGNTVVIDHHDGTFSRYAHLQYGSLGNVWVGKDVVQAEKIAQCGQTGFATGPHIHFQVQDSINGASISASFADIGSPQSGKFYTSQNIQGFVAGQGSPRQSLFQKAYAEIGGVNLGTPIEVTRWAGATNPIVVQEFRGGLYGDCTLVDDQLAGLGVWSLRGAVRSLYFGMGGSDSDFGPPRSDFNTAKSPQPFETIGSYQSFAHGHIYVIGNGTYYTTGDIDIEHANNGGVVGGLGYTTSSKFSIKSSFETLGWCQNFEGGNIYSSKFGTITVHNSPLRDKYGAQGWEQGPLGMVISGRYPFLNGTRQDFEGGSLTDGVSFDLSLTPNSIKGGSTSTGQITLPVPAPSGGVLVSLTSNDTTVTTVPTTVTVPEGATTTTFNINTATRNDSSSAVVTAMLLDVARQATLTVTTSVDTTAPTVLTSTPFANQNLLISALKAGTVMGTATDNVGVIKVEMKLSRLRNGVVQIWNGSAFTMASARVAATLAGTPQNATWTIKNQFPLANQLDAGEYIVVVYATDAIGNTGSATTRFSLFASDAQAPVLQLFTPVLNQKVLLSNFTSGAITGGVTDNVGVAGVKVKLSRKRGTNYYWNGTAFTTSAFLLNATVTPAGGANVKWNLNSQMPPLAQLDSGIYQLDVYAVDVAGNKSATLVRPFTLGTDFLAPSVSITAPTQSQRIALNAFGMGTINGTASDNLGVTNVKIKLQRKRGTVTTYWNGTTFTTSTATVDATVKSVGGTNVTWILANSPTVAQGLDTGAYILYASAYDAAGNTKTTASRSFTIASSASTSTAESAPSTILGRSANGS